jgi:hypothetical protein
MDSRISTIIVSQFFVAKTLKTEPARAIKFVKVNREYFPEITDSWLEQIMKEHNISPEQLEAVEVEKLNKQSNT